MKDKSRERKPLHVMGRSKTMTHPWYVAQYCSNMECDWYRNKLFYKTISYNNDIVSNNSSNQIAAILHHVNALKSVLIRTNSPNMTGQLRIAFCVGVRLRYDKKKKFWEKIMTLFCLEKKISWCVHWGQQKLWFKIDIT